LFRLLLERTQLLWCCLRSNDIKVKLNARKTDWDIGRYAKRATQIQVSFYADLDAFRGNPHGGSDELTGELSAGSKRTEEKLTGASCGAGSSNPGVGLGLIEGTSDINGA